MNGKSCLRILEINFEGFTNTIDPVDDRVIVRVLDFGDLPQISAIFEVCPHCFQQFSIVLGIVFQNGFEYFVGVIQKVSPGFRRAKQAGNAHFFEKAIVIFIFLLAALQEAYNLLSFVEALAELVITRVGLPDPNKANILNFQIPGDLQQRLDELSGLCGADFLAKVWIELEQEVNLIGLGHPDVTGRSLPLDVTKNPGQDEACFLDPAVA